MKESWIQMGFTQIGNMLSWYLGGFDGFIYVLIAFMAVDYIMGVLRAIVEKKFSSQIGLHDIIKKVVIFLIVGIAHTTELYLLSNRIGLRTTIIFFYILNFGLSILKNANEIDVPYPKQLKEILVKLYGESRNDGKD